MLRTSRLAAFHDFVQLKLITRPDARLAYKIVVMSGTVMAAAHIIGCLWLHDGLVHAGLPPHGSWVDKRDWYSHVSTRRHF
jgi:hypothetical protein